MTNDDIYQALKEVKDPELGENIVDLGLIYSVKIDGERVDIQMTLTTPGCPLATVIIQMMRDALASIPGFNPELNAHIEIVWDPPWTIDMISEEAKANLGF